jgi:hypothetical protein
MEFHRFKLVYSKSKLESVIKKLDDDLIAFELFANNIGGNNLA